MEDKLEETRNKKQETRNKKILPLRRGGGVGIKTNLFEYAGENKKANTGFG